MHAKSQSGCPAKLVAEQLADTTLKDLFAMRDLALAVPDGPSIDQVREDALTAALFAARCRWEATAAEIAQVQVRTRICLEYVEGVRGKRGALSTSAAEQAAGRDEEYLRAKMATADLMLRADAAAAIARDLAMLAHLPQVGLPFPTFAVAAGGER